MRTFNTLTVLATAAILASTVASTAAAQSIPPARLLLPGADLSVASQAGDYYAVSREPETVTLFEAPLEYSVTALIAHNYLSGGLFYQVETGDRLTLQYPDGSAVAYQVESIRQFQSLGEAYPYYEFKDLATGRTLTDLDVFQQVYQDHPGSLILQTCLRKAGKGDWGLTFWIASPAPAPATVIYFPLVFEQRQRK